MRRQALIGPRFPDFKPDPGNVNPTSAAYSADEATLLDARVAADVADAEHALAALDAGVDRQTAPTGSRSWPGSCCAPRRWGHPASRGSS